MFRKILVAAALVGMATASSAATIRSAVSATASSETTSINNTIDQSGLVTGFVSGVTDFDTYISGDTTHTFAPGLEWFGASGTNSATVDYDMGAVYKVGRMAFWNEDGAGSGLVSLLGSLDGIVYSALTSFAPTDHAFATDYTADIISFASTNARYFRLEISGCPQSGNAFISCSIGEVAFDTASSDGAVPVPASLPLLLGAIGGLTVLRRRKKV